MLATSPPQTCLSMWYQNNRPAPVFAPSRSQKLNVRIMIVLGVLTLGLFFWEITKEEYIGYKPLYYPLLFSLGYIALRILYEWYHYWDISMPQQRELKQDFTVDIFTTYVPGEPYEMLIETLEAIQKISYPHTTYLCDEGDDAYLKEQCERLGVVHVYRGTEKKNAKAGNINHAIYKHAKGDICLILDPDHIPAPDFLDYVLPHFQDPEVGFVQAVQAYKNIYENLIAKASAQQTFQFYGPIMMSMNSYGTAQAIGANCTFRRKALDSIGGHAAGLAEDMHTSMKLHAQGWKSVYVPRVLTRGLVPNTLSAYFKQQLKWSRGVFELLVTTYPKVFQKLTWRQKLHYGLLPWHYFMGFLFLINFLVPIVSLLTAQIPMRVGLAYFLAYSAPLLSFIIMIRHYVQKWVMEEDERGFHVQGGLIAIGTWWIHALGFIFTLLRRKVPYNPTPKDGKDENTLGLNIPNLALAGISVTAIVYGLWTDLNPYSLIMASFASLNVLFIAFVFFASLQNQWRRYKRTVPWLDWLFIQIWKVKDWFWRVRHGSYRFIRIVAPAVAVVLGFFLYYITSMRDITKIDVSKENPKVVQHFIAQSAKKSDYRVQYQSFDFFSSANEIRQFLHEAESAGKYPYLDWQVSNDTFSLKDFHGQLLSQQLEQQLDTWLLAFDLFESPIYFNPLPKYQSSYSDEDLRLEKEIWQYLNLRTNQSEINNLMPIFSCPKPSRIHLAFPGLEFIEFLEINADSIISSANPLDSLEIYLLKPSFLHSTPWTIRLNAALEKDKSDLIDAIVAEHPEFSGMVYTGKGSFTPDNYAHFKAFGQLPIPRPQDLSNNQKAIPKKSNFYQDPLLACNYYKGLEWENTQHPLFRRVIEADFKEMKSLGITHINRYGPSIYDANLLKEAEAQGINLSYAFYIADIKSFDPSNPKLARLEEKILSAVKDLKDETSIKAWHLGGSPYNQLDQYYHPPQQFYEKEKLLAWLESLSQKIKAIDPSRPLSAELDYSINIIEEASSIFNSVQALDGIGVNLNHAQLKLEEIEQRMAACKSPIFINSVGPDVGVQLAQKGYRVCFNSWQDDVFANYVSLDGLKNLEGYRKRGYKLLEKNLLEEKQTMPLDQYEDFKIVPIARPAPRTWNLAFTTIVKQNGAWKSLEGEAVKVRWYIVKLAAADLPALIEPLDQGGARINVKMPDKRHLYRLVAYLEKDGYTMEARSTLGSYIYEGPNLIEPSREEIEYKIRKRI